MILFDLRCSQGHSFEAWFRDSKSYERLAAAGEITCAVCGDEKVEKALMAPNVRTKKAKTPALPSAPIETPGEAGGRQEKAEATPMATSAPSDASEPAKAPYSEKVVEVMTMLRKAQTFIEKNFDPVGKKFAEEARKMHHGEAEKRGIFGEATAEETEALAEEGIEVNQIPWLPSRDS